jgi:cytochrome d ubiquinol oxidase subunit I
VPRLLSFLATGHFDGKVQGIDDVQAAEQAKYGPGNYKPVIPLAYWNFRIMVGIGFLTALIALLGLWLLRRGRLPENRWVWRIGVLSLALPFVANSAGWIFTEMGRQPWSVYGVMKTASGVSPNVGATSMLISVIALTTLYGVLMVIEAGVMVRYVKAGPPPADEVLAPPGGDGADAEPSLTFAY